MSATSPRAAASATLRPPSRARARGGPAPRTGHHYAPNTLSPPPVRALVFGTDPGPVTSPLPADANRLEQNLRGTPMGLREIEHPAPTRPAFAVRATRVWGD